MERDITNEQLIALIKERNLFQTVLNEIEDTELQEELSNRFLESDLEYFDDEYLIAEVTARGYTVNHSDLRQITDIIFQQKRTGKPFNTELDRLIYEITGRFI